MAAILPIPMFVAMFFVVCDVFHANKDAEYMRITEAYQSGYIFFNFLLYLFTASMFLGLPVVAFSLVLEYLCKTGAARFFAGVALGFMTGLFLAWLTTSSFTLISGWYIAEAAFHVLGAISVATFVATIVNLLHGFGGRKSVQPDLSNPVL